MAYLEAYAEIKLVVLASVTSLRPETLLRPDPRRTVIRPFSPGDSISFGVHGQSRSDRVIDRILQLDDATLDRDLRRLENMLRGRHRNVDRILLRRFDELAGPSIDGSTLDRRRKLLIGGYFSAEYSFEAAALFNPSIAPHWDQSEAPENGLRFVLSLRGIGEGHVSSITFRTGSWVPGGDVVVDPPSRYASPPRITQIAEEGDQDGLVLEFEDIGDISEAVVFPMTPSQRQGLEDLRLVRWEDDDPFYFGTFTAFNGVGIRSELLCTRDFRRIDMRPLTGEAVANKGMALFPRRIDGRYAMLGRQDNENIWLMKSDDLYRWDEAEKILMPEWSWEFVQIGNCGSPIEIEEGWLVILHGVGMVRNYTIGACLLDKRDPSKVLARTATPLLYPTPEDRDGYVPNVVYSCGSLLHGRHLLLPYAVADNVSTFASLGIDDLLARMN